MGCRQMLNFSHRRGGETFFRPFRMSTRQPAHSPSPPQWSQRRHPTWTSIPARRATERKSSPGRASTSSPSLTKRTVGMSSSAVGPGSHQASRLAKGVEGRARQSFVHEARWSSQPPRRHADATGGRKKLTAPAVQVQKQQNSNAPFGLVGRRHVGTGTLGRRSSTQRTKRLRPCWTSYQTGGRAASFAAGLHAHASSPSGWLQQHGESGWLDEPAGRGGRRTCWKDRSRCSLRKEWSNSRLDKAVTAPVAQARRQ